MKHWSKGILIEGWPKASENIWKCTKVTEHLRNFKSAIRAQISKIVLNRPANSKIVETLQLFPNASESSERVHAIPHRTKHVRKLAKTSKTCQKYAELRGNGFKKKSSDPTLTNWRYSASALSSHVIFCGFNTWFSLGFFTWYLGDLFHFRFFAFEKQNNAKRKRRKGQSSDKPK